MPFETTQWSLVIAAGGDDSSAARAALGTLCDTYWYPIYAFIRRRGHDAEDARDLTQGLFASLITRRSFEDLSPDRGRFRSFLLAAARHFLANDAARRRAEKRGGGAVAVPLDLTGLDAAETRYQREPADDTTPETLFERRWALTVVDGVLADLRAEWTAAGRTAEFDALKACLLGDGPAGGYAATAASLGSSEGAIKVAVHRLRRAFRDRLRQRIAATVASPAELDDELRYLIRSLSM